jgi:type II secretory pathway pseudopilin PulG
MGTVPNQRKRIFRALVLSLVFLLLAFSVGSWITELRQSARSAACQGQLSQLGLALQNYREDKGSYPPLVMRNKDGKPMHSWRVLLLPYFEYTDAFQQYDLSEPWDSPKNMRWAHTVGASARRLFASPNDPGENNGWASLLAIDYGSPDSADGRVALDRQCPNSMRIVLAEVHNSGIYWMEPRDLPVQTASVGLIRHAGGAESINFLTAGGQVGTLSRSSMLFHGSEQDLLQRLLAKPEPNTVNP